MEYYSAIKRNLFESVLMRWMNLEAITQSEVSQKEKDKHHILMYIQEIQKNVTKEFTETDIENRLMDMGIGEERVRYMERVTWKLTLQYVKYIANRNLLCGSRNSNRGSVSIQMGKWGGRWEGGSK